MLDLPNYHKKNIKMFVPRSSIFGIGLKNMKGKKNCSKGYFKMSRILFLITEFKWSVKFSSPSNWECNLCMSYNKLHGAWNHAYQETGLKIG